MTRGHAYVAFSKPYEEAAAHSVRALRRFSSLPVVVLTDLEHIERSPIWDELSDVKFTVFPDSDPLTNRSVKTRLCNFVPFDQTLYTDADTVIQSRDFVRAFKIAEHCDIAFPYYEGKGSDERIATPVYQRAVDTFGLRPIEKTLWVYQGGVFIFNKNERVKKFFDTWNQYWNVHKFRDMPPLMATVHTIEDVAVGLLPHDFGFPDSRVIQHFYGWKPPKSEQMPPFRKFAPDERTMRWKWDKNLSRWRR